MIRNILIVLGAILLSGLFVGIWGMWFANSPEMALMMRIAGAQFTTENDATELWKAMDRILFICNWIISPLVAVAVGLFVGFFARQYPIRLAILGIALFAVLFSGFRLTELGFTIGYIFIASGLASIVSRCKRTGGNDT